MVHTWIVGGCIYQNHDAAYSFILHFSLSNIQTSDEILRHILSVTMKTRFETWYTLGQWWMYHVYQNHDAAAYSLLYCSISLSLSLSLQFSNIKNFHHFSQELLGLEGLNLVHVEFI